MGCHKKSRHDLGVAQRPRKVAYGARDDENMRDFVHIFRNRWPLKEAYNIFSFTCRHPIMMSVHNSCIRIFSPKGVAGSLSWPFFRPRGLFSPLSASAGTGAAVGFRSAITF